MGKAQLQIDYGVPPTAGPAVAHCVPQHHPAVVRSADPIIRSIFGMVAPTLDAASITLSAVAAGCLYHLVFYGSLVDHDSQMRMGALVALFVIAESLLRGGYDLSNFHAGDRHLPNVLRQWTLGFLVGLCVAFFTKTGAAFSRGAVIMFYVCGFFALAGARTLMVCIVRRMSRNGPILARRAFLVGSDLAILAFVNRHWPLNRGVQIVGVASISPGAVNNGQIQMLERELSAAVASARLSGPDEVFLLLDRDRYGVIDQVIESFSTIPAAIHLGSERMLDRFVDAKVSKIGAITLLSLTRQPLSVPEIAAKRAFDLAASILGLILLSPLVLIVAALIKYDSPGPVFFLQRRYGFNQKQFRIFKFRTMTTLDDGPVVAQVSVGDQRITRVGAFLRRWNIDELPQLLNVIRGEMSLVGPRPHALAHDHLFMQRIALYARRHNVKPGITGWAQVNGFRGETSTDDKMRGRVEHDFSYIDQWSMLLDLKIILLTIFSRKAYRNAR